MLNFIKKHKIKGGEVEYLVELRLNGYGYPSISQGFEFGVSCREKGKKEWEELTLKCDVKKRNRPSFLK